jgi:hypothetical protein
MKGFIHLIPDEVGNRRMYRQRDRPAVIQFWPIFSFLNNEEDAAYSALIRCVLVSNIARFYV